MKRKKHIYVVGQDRENAYVFNPEEYLKPMTLLQAKKEQREMGSIFKIYKLVEVKE